MRADILILGGSLSGLAFALAAGRAGLSTVVVEARSFPRRGDRSMTTAVGRASRRMFESLGVWSDLGHRAPIFSIRVEDVLSGQGLDFDAAEADGDPLGHIVLNRSLIEALVRRCGEDRSCRILAPAVLREIEITPTGVQGRTGDGRRIEASVAVGADGGRSFLRRRSGIGVFESDYRQKAFVFEIEHERDHQGRAWECFFPVGPLAVLPMNDVGARHRSAVVWTVEESAAAALADGGRRDFEAFFTGHWGDRLGSARVRRAPVAGVDLSLLRAHAATAPRVALIGDAVHRLHPVAGQGINLGWRDAAVLADVFHDAAALGIDIGSPGVLAEYDERRRFDVTAMSAATDLVNRLYSTTHPLARLARSAAMGTISRSALLRRLSMAYAMGSIPGAPPLLQGTRSEG